MSIIFRIFIVKINQIPIIDMIHNFCTKYGKILEICKQYSKNLVNELGNTTKRGVVPKFSDLEVIALSLTAEAMSIDSENCLFVRLQSYKNEFPNLISRRQYNARRKKTSKLCNLIRERIANEIDGNETYFALILNQLKFVENQEHQDVS